MKRLARFLAFAVTVVMVFSCLPLSAWADNDVLLSVNGKTIYSDTTIYDIYDMYGIEKLQTDSIFGGYAYTFYGNDYSDFLFIETNASGKIASYCTFGGSFTSNAGNYGEKASNVVYSLSGSTFTDYEDNNWGVVGYCAQNIEDREEPMTLYNSDAKYAESIAMHAAAMWNAVSKYFGKESQLIFDSRTFYMNRQLMEGGSNFYDYCNAVGKNDQFKLITSSSALPFLIQAGACYPNPGMYAMYARNYSIPSDSYPVFDCNEMGGMIIGSLRSLYFSESQHISYTEKEKELLSRAREIYNQSVDIYNSSEQYFEISPQDSTLPLEPGKIYLNKLQGALGYINAIRAGADLPLLELSEQLSEGCQYKAILTSYLSKNNISNPSPHFPPKIDGISDEYYDIAQSGSGENLYHGDIITSITNALNDAYGDPITCGHRYNLLDPNWKYIGFGSTEVIGHLSIGIQGVHKMSGYQQSDAEIVAWPSKGVMLEEAGAGSNTMYTAKFVKNYSFTDSTGVIFKCLNTGETYEFTAGQTNTSDHRLHKSGAIISYYDSNIAMTVGNVYEITLTNVKDNTTGTITNYTYRSVYESAFNSLQDNAASDIQLSDSSITVAVRKSAKLNASIIPSSCSNKMIVWESDDPSIASVNENGYVTGHKTGTAVISAKTDNNIIKYCTVTVVSTPFTDLTSKWYIPYIEKAYQNGLMSGMTPTTFEPSTGMTRGMFVKVLANIEGVFLDNNIPTIFSDVKVGRYYAGPINWASENGIVNGITPTEFAPEESITREQMCAMLIRYVQFKNITLDQSVAAVTFEDENKISDYAKEYVKICQRAGIIDGMTPTAFEPKGEATRAQVAKIFSVFLDYMA